MYDLQTIITMNNPEPAPACTEMEFVLPEFWLPALVNGDTTGLDEEDERALDAFLADLPERQCDVDELARMFPGCVLKRKSNGKAIHICDVKVKNIHWYE